jgi:DinB superfamily
MNGGNQAGLEICLRAALKSQYHAALAMIRQAIEIWPDDLWTGSAPNPFWQVAYHTAFCTHMYLQPNEAAFRPWEHHRGGYQFLGAPNVTDPYTKAQVLDYLAQCDAMTDAAVDALDLTASDCGFWWYKMSKLEHQFVNIRHIQHHMAQLAVRLRAAGVPGVDWIGPKESPTASVR